MEIKVIDNDGVRLDKYLMDKLDVSRSKAQKLIDNKNILVNGKSSKSSYTIKLEDEISVLSLEDEEYEIEAENRILFMKMNIC